MNEFIDTGKLKDLYSSDIVSMRGNFLKRYTNRKLSIRDIIYKYFLDEMAEKKIIDIGPGNGSFLKRLRIEFPFNEFYALDIVSNEEVKKDSNIKYVIYDGITIPENIKEFDYIFCMHMLYHVAKPMDFLKQIRNRVLQPDGKIIITTKSKETLPNVERIFREVIKEMNLEEVRQERDESNFCTENADDILNQAFGDQYEIRKYNIITQLIVDDIEALLQYIFSTMRYNLFNRLSMEEKKVYVNLWREKVGTEVYFDEVRECLIEVKKKR